MDSSGDLRGRKGDFIPETKANPTTTWTLLPRQKCDWVREVHRHFGRRYQQQQHHCHCQLLLCRLLIVVFSRSCAKRAEKAVVSWVFLHFAAVDEPPRRALRVTAKVMAPVHSFGGQKSGAFGCEGGGTERTANWQRNPFVDWPSGQGKKRGRKTGGGQSMPGKMQCWEALDQAEGWKAAGGRRRLPREGPGQWPARQRQADKQLFLPATPN